MNVERDELRLFYTGDLRALIDSHTEQSQLDSAVRGSEPARFATISDDEIVALLLDRFAINPLELLEGTLEMEWHEVHVDVRGQPHFIDLGMGGQYTPG